jgi:predicted esterase
MPMVHLLAALLPLLASAQDPVMVEPSAKAKAHTWQAWTSKGGLRYAWTLPRDYDGKTPRNLTVILHGTGLDYRWGCANHAAGRFRPDDIVVSPDGTSPGQGQSRLFLGQPKDALDFKAFLDELRTRFAVDRVFLYGHSQGAFFVSYFAGEQPGMVAGVVAHASGVWTWTRLAGKELKKTAYVFLHGSQDPVVPYGQSVGARDHLQQQGFPLVHLRRLHDYNHFPNAVRAQECLEWCEGMTSDDPAVALRCAEAMLRPKGQDEYQWETTVDFAGARRILRRVLGDKPGGFAQVPPAVKQQAEALLAKLDAHGEAQAKALGQVLGKREDLALSDKPIAGWVLPLREDLRGVPAVEALLARIGFDEVMKNHVKASKPIFDAWYNEKDPSKIFRAIVQNLPAAFLVDGYPPELPAKMHEWLKDARKMKLTNKEIADGKRFEQWEKSRTEGGKAWQEQWRVWK